MTSRTSRAMTAVLSPLIGRCGAAAVAVVVGLAASAAPAADGAGSPAPPVIVKLRDGVRIERDAAGAWTASTVAAPATKRSARSLSALGAELRRHHVLSSEAALKRTPRTPALARALGLDRYRILRLPAGADAAEVAASLAAQTNLVESAEVDGEGQVADVIPDDPLFSLQYALHNIGQVVIGQPGIPGADIDATGGWELATGSTGVTLAVLDSGANMHVELSGRLLSGWNVVSGTPDTSDSCSSHGTHVCGIAAANGDNSTGIAGVNWGVNVLPVRVLNGCTGLESDLANGITWAVDNGADVINMSLEYGAGTDFLRDAVEYAAQSGVIMVAAAGNNGFSGGVAFPGRWPETIAIAATNNRDQRAPFSNTGPELDVAAPGDDIYSLSGTTSYGYRDGTSMATPHVSALVALMLSIDPTLDTESTRTILRETADDVAEPGFDLQTGWGRIDMQAALQRVIDRAVLPGDANRDGTVDGLDISAVIEAWGSCPETGPCSADLDADGFVEVDDLIAVLVNWS